MHRRFSGEELLPHRRAPNCPGNVLWFHFSSNCSIDLHREERTPLSQLGWKVLKWGDYIQRKSAAEATISSWNLWSWRMLSIAETVPSIHSIVLSLDAVNEEGVMFLIAITGFFSWPFSPRIYPFLRTTLSKLLSSNPFWPFKNSFYWTVRDWTFHETKNIFGMLSREKSSLTRASLLSCTQTWSRSGYPSSLDRELYTMAMEKTLFLPWPLIVHSYSVATRTKSHLKANPTQVNKNLNRQPA